MTRPFALFEWMIAIRYLRVSVIAGFSIVGIMLSVAALIVVMSVMNGFHKELLGKILGINGHIFLQAADSPFTNYDEVSKRAAELPGVDLALPMVEGSAFAASAFTQGGAGTLVRGIEEADIQRLPGIANNIRSGTLAGFDEEHGAAIGQRLADNLNLRVGDKIKIITANGPQTPFGVAPRVKAYPVVAIFQIGMSEFDGLFVYLPLSDAQAFFNRDGDASVIEIFVRDPEKVDAIRARLEAAIDRPIFLTDWRERNRTFFDALTVERNVMFMILSLIVLVAALNIISGLIVLVKTKGHDIAILRTMGATRGAILRIFLMSGALIGAIGTFAGFLLGFSIAQNVEAIRQVLNTLLHANLFPAELYFLSRLPSVVEPRDVAAVVGLAFLLSVLATIYPSWRAARLDPVEALRYE
ncbi:MAG: lipoprotein-releasing ABC transporter permease subunit [Beijerinckiaceae bacterium]